MQMIKPRGIFYGLFFILLFVVVISTVATPIRQSFEYDPDEGTALANSALFLNGFSIYSRTWIDQPPLSILIFAYWFKLSGASIYSARILVLIFSGILLLSLYAIIKHTWSRLAAFMAVIFCLVSGIYLRLSVSAMAGTPAFSLAMLAILFITFYKKTHHLLLLALSGMIMGLALHVKFSPAFLIPIIIWEIARSKVPDESGGKESARLKIILWIGCGLSTYLFIALAFFGLDWHLFIQQLFLPHVSAPLRGSDFGVIKNMLLSDFDIALLALLSIIFLIRRKQWDAFFPALWLIAGFLVVCIYKPIWDHYYVFISIPICWLAAISLSTTSHLDTDRANQLKPDAHNKTDVCLRWVTIIIIVLTVLRLPAKCLKTHRSIQREVDVEQEKIVDLLLQYKHLAHWVFTDKPILAVYAGILTPPELTLISHKRKFITPADQNYCIDKLKEYNPELVVLSRFEYYGPQVISYIKKNYTLIYSKELLPQPYSDINTNAHFLKIAAAINGIDYWLMRIKANLENNWPPYRKHPYKLAAKRSGGLYRYATYHSLVKTVDELIELQSQATAIPLSKINRLSPIAIHENASLGLKPYDTLPQEWLQTFSTRSESFLAYEALQKLFKDFTVEQNKPPNKENLSSDSLMITRLELLKERIIQEIEYMKRNSGQEDIRVYIRNDTG